jgi:iron complex outermembrane receptor protein
MISRFLAASVLVLCAVPLWAQRPRADSAAVDSVRARRLAPVVVTGGRLAPETDRRLPVRVDVLEMNRKSHGASAAAELLQRLPGVSMSNDQGSSAQPTLELRGFLLSPVVGVAQGVSVFLDGVRINGADAQEVNFDLLPMEAVDRAELVPGSSALYGKNSLAGSLILHTARGDSVSSLRGGVETGSYGERDVHLMGSGMALGLDGLVMLNATTDDGYQVESGARTRQLFTTIGRRTGSGDVALSILYAHDRLSEAGSLPESWFDATPRANYTGGDFFRPELVHVALRGERAIGGASLRGNLFARHNAIEQLNVNAGVANTRAFVTNRVAGGTAELALVLSPRSMPLALSLGGELSRSRVDYRVLAESNPDSPDLPGECAVTTDPATALCEDALARGDDAGLYAQGLLDVTPALSLLVSARGDYARVPFEDRRDPSNGGTNTFRRVSPKLGITYRHDGLRTYVSVGSAFRAPAALELACASPDATCPLPFSLGADPPLRPVVVWSYEAGTSWAPSVGSTVALSLYHTDVRDEIVFVSAERAAGYFQTVARTRRDGLESSFSATLPFAGLRTFGSYSFVAATYRSSALLASALDGNAVGPGSEFAQSLRHRANAGLGFTRVGATTVMDGELRARAVSSAFLRGDEGNRMAPMPGYVVSDARLQLRRARLSGMVEVLNLFDRRYAIFGVFAANPKGGIGQPAPAVPPIERFLTPAYPRTARLSFEIER